MARVAEAMAYRRDHPEATRAEIADHVAAVSGEPCSAKTVAGYFWDPDGGRARARKERYRDHCEVCGAELHGGDGHGRGSTHCTGCARDKARDAVADRLWVWAERYRRVPTSTDLNRTAARRRGTEALERYEGAALSASLVTHHYGTYGAGVEAVFGAGTRPGQRFNPTTMPRAHDPGGG
jgi:hypothetical protein